MMEEYKKKYRAFSVVPWKEDYDILEMIKEVVILWLGILCVIGWLGDLCALNFSRFAVFTTALFMVISFLYILQKVGKQHKKSVYMAYAFVPLVFLLSATIQTGIAGLCHEIAVSFSRRGIRLLYQGVYVEESLGKTLFMILLTAWILLWIRFCMEHSKIPVCVLFILMLLMEMRFGDGSSVRWIIMFVFWILLYIMKNVRAYIFLILPLAGIALIFSTVFGITSGEGWKDHWNRIRYGQQSDILPDGDMTRAASVNRKDKIALRLENDQSGYYYLKGFVGTVYKDNIWYGYDEKTDDFETGIVGGTGEFLSWLHEKGYSGWNELASRKNGVTEHTLVVHNKRANRHYIYVPYELTTDANQIEAEGMGVFSSGESLYARGVFGKKNYRVKTAGSFADQSLTSAKEPQVIEQIYRAYEEYVNRTCLTLPKDVKETLRDELGGSSTVGVDDTLALVKKIRKWISSHVKYDENPGAVAAGDEFVDWFFNENTRGYDVQCASIATMMFRYYGVPSRYVEGYLVENTQNVTQESAHAWVEIYLTGQGWIPVEVMERYQERMPSYMEEDGGTIYSNSSNTQTAQKDANKQQNKSEKNQKKDENKTEEKKSGGAITADDDGSVIPWILLTLLIVAIILAVIILSGLRIREFFYRRRATESISSERSIAMWYQYCIWLIYELEKDPLAKADMAVDNRLSRWEERWELQHPEVNKKVLHKIGLLRQKAIYRRKGIDLAEMEIAVKFFKKEYKYLYKKLDFAGRCRVRLGIRPSFFRKNPMS